MKVKDVLKVVTVAAAMALLYLTSPKCQAEEKPATPPPFNVSQQVSKAWLYACEYKKNFNCHENRRPRVVWTLDLPFYVNGVYQPDTYYIMVNMVLYRRPEAITTLTHEFIHYMQGQLGEFTAKGGVDQGCKVEEEAYRIARLVAYKEQLETALWPPTWEQIKHLYEGCGEKTTVGSIGDVPVLGGGSESVHLVD